MGHLWLNGWGFYHLMAGALWLNGLGIYYLWVGHSYGKLLFRLEIWNADLQGSTLFSHRKSSIPAAFCKWSLVCQYLALTSLKEWLYSLAKSATAISKTLGTDSQLFFWLRASVSACTGYGMYATYKHVSFFWDVTALCEVTGKWLSHRSRPHSVLYYSVLL